MENKVLVSAYLDMNLGDCMLLEIILDSFSDYNISLLADNEFTYNWIKKKYHNIKIINTAQMDDQLLRQTTDYIKVGGSMFQHNTWYEGILRYKEVFVLKRLKKYGIKIHIVNCNIGPIKTKVGLGSTKKIIKLADSISCRDDESYNFIKKYKNENNILKSVDLVFSKSIKKQKQKQKFIIGISVYTAYTPHLIKKNYQYCLQVVEIIKQYEEKNNYTIPIKLFLFDTFRNNDYPNALWIKEWCRNNKIDCDIIPYFENIDCIIDIMEECSLMVATRFHSIILSLLLEIPCIPIIYSNKSKNLLDFLGHTQLQIKFGDSINNDICDPENNLLLTSKELNELSAEAKKQIEFMHIR